MDKIKKRILGAVTNIQLAKNEIDRLTILGKDTAFDAETISVVDLLVKLAGEIKHVSDQNKSA